MWDNESIEPATVELVPDRTTIKKKKLSKTSLLLLIFSLLIGSVVLGTFVVVYIFPQEQISSVVKLKKFLE